MALRWRVPTVVVLAVALGACTIEEVPRPTRVDLDEVAREEISTSLEAYRDAVLGGDAEALAASFAPDGRLYQPDQPDLIGRDAIRDGMQHTFNEVAVSDLLLGREVVDVLDGDIAYEFGTYEETRQIAPQPPVVQRGRYAIRWLRNFEAQWLIDRLLVSHYPADTTAAR